MSRLVRFFFIVVLRIINKLRSVKYGLCTVYKIKSKKNYSIQNIEILPPAICILIKEK